MSVMGSCTTEMAYLDVVAEEIGHYPPDYVEAYVSACMAHVRLTVYCWSASVPCHFIRIVRYKLLLHAEIRD